ncbi:MAG: 16S rRNA (cytosine(1402)-N(4))-methyltransferase RsmH [Turneriella sp.]|nr:16S rRNA (cytosine(1402)-N(4))-methyltransferase RsmH [Turneriella sp.]
MQPSHESVLVSEVIAAAESLKKLPPQHRKVWDGTLGLGGHLIALAQHYPDAQFFASDLDASMLNLAAERLTNYSVVLKHANFAENPFAADSPFGFILLDLGISSVHLDHFERGFSFRRDQYLDMRLDSSQSMTAASFLCQASEKQLAEIFWRFGEERHARAIARAVIKERCRAPIETTGQLATLCRRFYPQSRAAKHRSGKDPATRVFQALRIAVNRELDSLERALAFLPDLLCPGGRLAIITFHSLEDRLVKHAFRNRERIAIENPTAKSRWQPGDFQVLFHKGITPTAEEIRRNPRARSARLRVLERKQAVVN